MIAPRETVLYGWGMANHARSLTYRPRTTGEVREALEDARRRSVTVAHRGAGQSYGDAALNQGGAVLLLEGLNRILGFVPSEGRIRAQAGVTIEQLWRRVVGDGWWPPVVPGTSRTTLGGCLAMNVHGKNHVQAGSFGEHVRAITVLTPELEMRRLERGDAEFAWHVGAMGLHGTILELELELTPIRSGYLEVHARAAAGLSEALALLRDLEEAHDFTVGWVDCFAGRGARGRGEVHAASYLPAGHALEDLGLSPAAQTPPERLLGIVPRRRVASLLGPVLSDPGIRSVNAAKYRIASLVRPSTYAQLHASFHFLLDYLTGWRRAYLPGGLLQYQFFVPEDEAEDVFEEALRLQRDGGPTSYLGVLKRHRVDPFPSNYSVDGYSLALDFAVRRKSVPGLMSLVRTFDSLQREAGGRVYAAKDAVSRLGALPDDIAPGYSSNLVRRWRANAR